MRLDFDLLDSNTINEIYVTGTFVCCLQTWSYLGYMVSKVVTKLYL